ncbi:MAG: ThiF family adenylyltransferase [Pseudomonadota bacterium]
MVKIPLDGSSWHLIMPEGMFAMLRAHLYPGDGDEHGAVIEAGLARTSDGRIRLLARALHIATDGVDYVPGKRGYRMLRAPFIRDRIRECRDEQLVYLAIHNHGGDDSVSFSKDDLDSHERGYPALLDIADGMPVGALVFANHAIAGDIWLPDGRRVPLTDACIVGRRRDQLFPAPPRRAGTDPNYDRQVRLFGDAGQDILRSTRIAIIGLGGVGSLLAEYLGHLGVGHFVLIDPDRIEGTNLPRVVGATAFDARTWLTRGPWPEWLQTLAKKSAKLKVQIARRMIRRINKRAIVETYPVDVLEPKAAARLLDCDYIFLAADSMRARLLFNAIVHQYLIPGVQIGSKVMHDEASGALTSVHSIIRPVTPECGCLWCNQVINPSKLQEEGQTERERKAQRYVDDKEVAAPSVVTLNALGAAQAANDFLFFMTGLTELEASAAYMRFDPRLREAKRDNPRHSPQCTECGPNNKKSRLARGDLGKRLPVFHRI